MDKVSVIMSTYKEPIEWIQQSVDSILNQTYKNLEFIIIVDNHFVQESLWREWMLMIYLCLKDYLIRLII